MTPHFHGGAGSGSAGRLPGRAVPYVQRRGPLSSIEPAPYPAADMRRAKRFGQIPRWNILG